MKDEVPPALVDAHTKAVGQAVRDGQVVDASFNLDKSGIAGTETEKSGTSTKEESGKDEGKEGVKEEKGWCGIKTLFKLN